MPLLEQVMITDVAAEGKALAKVEERVIFVPFVAPGDVVDVQLVKKKANYGEGKAVMFHAYSPHRVEPECTHFGTCGGCKWQHLDYALQIEAKHRQVIDALERIGKVHLDGIRPIKGAEKIYYYRNKLEFTFSNRRWLDRDQMGNAGDLNMNGLGFHIPRMFDKVLDISECHLQSELSDQIRLEAKRFALANGYSFMDLRSQEGLMRNIIIRSTTTGDLMVIVVFHEHDHERLERMLSHLAEQFPQITSLLYIINEKRNDTITDQEVLVYKGKDHIIEEMEGLKFKIGPKSFYQTNSDQAYTLYKVARDFADLTGDELVYDLYTGTGTIANFVARSARQVIGVEYVPEAIEDAKVNSAINGIDNTLFYAGDMKDLLNQEFIELHGRPDVIITDPPRAGMHDSVIETILFAAPRRIVYVSCNPSTQARDLALMDEHYAVCAVQPVDMFPHTHHVENVVLLVRRDTLE